MITNQRQIEEAMRMLAEVDKSDIETAHIDADSAILYYLKVTGARELAETYEDLKLEVGFRFA